MFVLNLFFKKIETNSAQGFPCGSDGKESTCNAGDLGSIPGLGRSPGVKHDNPLQDSCLENPMDGGAWLAAVRGVAKSRSRLSNFTFTFQADYSENHKESKIDPWPTVQQSTQPVAGTHFGCHVNKHFLC